MSLILTLQLDSASQERFDALRRRHFPPERNLIAAHLTLFHQLPETEDTVLQVRSAAERRERFPLTVTGVRSLGRGVAYRLHSPTLKALHAELVRSFAADLTAQDRQPFDPHVVVQNKVDPAAAKVLLAQLSAGFTQSEAMAVGLELWRYLGGPWEYVATFAFS